MYLDPYGTPYAYFRPGRRPSDELYHQSDNEQIPQVTPDDVGQTAVAYHLPQTNPRVIEWYNSSTFQILSAGRDRRFGRGKNWPSPPDEQRPDSREFTEALDNLTNFCDGRLQTLLK